MAEGYYTLASWRVKPGQEDAFVALWRDELAAHFRRLDPSATGTLVRSLEDPHLFYSFGPWASLEAMQAVRSDPGTAAVLARLAALCDEARPGPYRVVLTIP